MNQLRDSALLLLAYVATAKFGIAYSSLPPGNLSMIWLPAGIAIIGLVRLGWGVLPLVFIGSSIVNWPTMLDVSTSASFLHSIGHAITSSTLDTIQPAIGAWMYKRFCREGCLFSEKSFLLFILGVALLPALLTCWGIILNFHLGGYVAYETANDLFVAIRNTTITDALGIFMVVPLYDAMIGLKGQTLRRRNIVEFVGWLSALAVFLFWVTSTNTIRPIVALIPLTFLALRNGVVGSSVGYLATAIALIIATVNGQGPYSIKTMNEEFFSLMLYLISIGLPIHLVAISMRSVRRFNATLEKRVDERTIELREKETQLTELNQEKDRLMSIIAHDLRNPVQGILGLSQLMTTDVRQNEYEDLDSYAGMIQGSAQQTLQLLQNLMEWSASQSGRTRFNPQDTDISALVSETLRVVEVMAKSKSITLHLDVDMGLTAKVDKQMMATILRNLVSNSLKFTPSGGSVTTSAHSVDNGFRLRVTDTGIGMSQEQIESLLRGAHQSSSHGTNGEKGSGLGMLLVHDFTLRLGGTLRIDSEPGRGTTFDILFPSAP